MSSSSSQQPLRTKKRVHILLIPYPAHGHMHPLLDLAHLLSSRFGLAVTVAVTLANRPLLDPLLARSPAVEPLVLPFPDYPSIPRGVENTKDLPPDPFPYFHHLMRAFAGLHEPLVRWARARPDPPTAIVSDLFCGWTLRLGDKLGIPRLVFSPSAALSVAVTDQVWSRMPQRSNSDDPDEPVAFPSLPNSPVYRWRELSGSFRRYRKGDPISEFMKEGFLNNARSWGFVFNTFCELESAYLDHLKRSYGHGRVWAVGPLAPPSSAAGDRGGRGSVAAEEVTTWLDGREDGSVVYVAFGSHTTLSRTQAAALAEALERSGVSFVWSARGGTAVPEGFEERAAGRGLVIHGWAPQVAILEHEAVGSFLTHCGWNSVMEAAATGVALLTWPMDADQFLDARLVVDDVGIGAVACDGGPDAVPDASELARVMAESVGEAGRRLRDKAKELKKIAAGVMQEGGSSYRQLESLVMELSA